MARQQCLYNWIDKILTLPELLKKEPYLPEREIISRALQGKVKLTRNEVRTLHRKSSECGQFFTPDPVAELMASLAEIKAGETVLDPACGLGNLMFACLPYTENVSGIELMFETSMLASKVLGLDVRRDHSLESISEIKSCDVVIANPPFGPISRSHLDNWEEFQLNRKNGKVLGRNRLEVLFLELCLRVARRRVVIIVPDGILSNEATKYIRKWILSSFGYRATISLPHKLFWKSSRNNNKWLTPVTNTKTSIMVIDKLKPEGNYKVFMAISKELEDIPKVREAWEAFNNKNVHLTI